VLGPYFGSTTEVRMENAAISFAVSYVPIRLSIRNEDLDSIQ
jgi:hypothetical protein